MIGIEVGKESGCSRKKESINQIQPFILKVNKDEYCSRHPHRFQTGSKTSQERRGCSKELGSAVSP